MFTPKCVTLSGGGGGDIGATVNFVFSHSVRLLRRSPLHLVSVFLQSVRPGGARALARGGIYFTWGPGPRKTRRSDGARQAKEDGRTRTIFVHKSENPFYLTEALQPCPTDCTVCTALRDHLLRPGQLTFPGASTVLVLT